jgi:rod shape-determining protein MreD
MSRRMLLAAACIITALLVQVVVVDRLHLPAGAPDLLLVVVVSLALVWGPSYGAVAGFVAGFVADILPPADHTVGRLAFVYAIVGYLAGLLEDAEERSVLAAVGVVALGSAAAVAVYGGIGALLGDARVTAHAVGHALVSVVIYDVVLAPFIVPLVSGAARRVEPVTTY